MPGLATDFAGAARAIVIPHEVLWRVPFEALPTETGYVADTTSIVYTSSVTALVNARELSSKKVVVTAIPNTVVAVGGPTFKPDVVERIAATSPGWALRTSANAGEELQAVAADPERTLVIKEDDATEALVRERLRFADVIHLATPFRLNGGSPLFSPMLFAADAWNDGTLEPREIMNLDLEARLAILSDGAALAMRDAADDTAAIAWAWQAAGVATLVMPRWATTGGASNELLAAVHARLREGESPEAALQSARARLRANPATAAPYAWAGWLFLSRQ
jgi:CHAT domain-containing protein